MSKRQDFNLQNSFLSVLTYWEKMNHLSRESLPTSDLRLRVEVDVTPESFSKFLVVNVTYKRSHTIIIYLAKKFSTFPSRYHKWFVAEEF